MTYSFVVARFIPDPVRNEPVNIGIIVNDSKTHQSFGRFVEDFSLLSCLINCSLLKISVSITLVSNSERSMNP